MNRIINGLLITLLSTVSGQGLVWEPLHYPPSSGTYDIEILDDGSMLTAIATEGVFKSIDNGQHWAAMIDGLPYLDVQDLTQSESGAIYAVSAAGIFKLDTLDNHWESLEVPQENYQKITSIGDSILITAVHLSLYISRDAGENWQRPETEGLPGFNAFMQWDDSTIYAGTSGGVYRSDDGGSSWVNTGLSNWFVNDIKRDSNGRIYALIYWRGQGLYYSDDEGETWVHDNQGLEAALNWSLEISETDQIYVGSKDGILYRKSTTELAYEPFMPDGQFSMITDIVANPAGELFVGTELGGIYFRSQDSDHFDPINQGLSMRRVQMLGSAGQYSFAANMRSGVFRSADAGLNWFPIAPHLGGSHQFRFLGKEDHALLATTIEMVWVGYLWQSLNQGVNWEVYQNGIPLFDPTLPWINVVADLGEDQAGNRYALINIDGLFRMAAGSDIWTDISSSYGEEIPESMCIGNGNELYLGTRSGGVFVSYDWGDSWENSLAGAPDSWIHSIKRGANGVFALRTNLFAAESTETFRTLDQGLTWQSIHTEEVGSRVNTVVEIGSNQLLIATDSLGILSTVDNGETWQLEDTGLTTLQPTSLTYLSDGVLVAGSEDAGMFRTVIQPSSTKELNPESYILLYAYPNPFNPSTVSHLNIWHSLDNKIRETSLAS